MLLSKTINQHALQAIASYFLTVPALRVVANSNVLACYYLEIAKYLLMTILTSHIFVGNTAQCRPSGLCRRGFNFLSQLRAVVHLQDSTWVAL